MKSTLKALVDELSPETRRFVRIQGDIAARISDLLKEKKLIKSELADMLGMKKSQLSSIQRRPSNMNQIRSKTLPKG